MPALIVLFALVGRGLIIRKYVPSLGWLGVLPVVRRRCMAEAKR